MMTPLERAIQAQSEWIRQCQDPAELLDRMAEYREDVRAGARTDDAFRQKCASDLLAQAEDRVVELKADRIREARAQSDRQDRMERMRHEQEQQARAARERAIQQQQARAEDEPEARRRDKEKGAAERREWERRTREQERLAAARQAKARAAEVESRAAASRVRAERVAKTAPAPEAASERTTSVAVAREPRRELRPPAREEEGSVQALDPMEAADRAALVSVRRWPAPTTLLDRAPKFPSAQWPADWILTGYDLAIFRGDLNLSQHKLAVQLGVPSVEVAHAEARPMARLRPAMQVALREAMEKAQRRQVAAKALAPEEVMIEPASAGLPPVRVPTTDPKADALTGADLARWRAGAGLSQRQAALKLGVAHGTVAKAELVSDKPLSEQLAQALRAATLG